MIMKLMWDIEGCNEDGDDDDYDDGDDDNKTDNDDDCDVGAMDYSAYVC